MLILAFTALILGGCSLKMPKFDLWGDDGNRLSPRVVEYGQPVPKGGGRYKIGSSYRINGQLYVPREVDRYDETGIASWYGMLYHGRRTANGEVYDMEALTAAHPTLPIPSYVRVTSLKNGRSMVVRVNDRGPYANNRIIDLSWAVATLLNIERAGTGPVRVEYLGRAPLSGDDRYERDMLASQPWAGPRVAYAKSPAKAMRAGYASAPRAPETVSVAKARAEKANVVASVSAQPAQKLGLAPMVAPPPAVRSTPLKERFEAAEKRAGPKPDHKLRIAENHVQAATSATVPPKAGKLVIRRRPAKPKVAASGKIEATGKAEASRAVTPPASDYYVEAGLFPQKSTAEQLAEILKEIAPATVEPVEVGERPLHKVRLGPFTASAAAKAAAQRIRAAGLSGARVEESGDG